MLLCVQLIMNVPFNGIYFGAYEVAKKALAASSLGGRGGQLACAAAGRWICWRLCCSTDHPARRGQDTAAAGGGVLCNTLCFIVCGMHVCVLCSPSTSSEHKTSTCVLGLCLQVKAIEQSCALLVGIAYDLMCSPWS